MLLFFSCNSAAKGDSTKDGFEYVVDDRNEVCITKYTGEANKLTIPSKINGRKVTGIGASAFDNCLSSSITIPDSVTSIGDWAFTFCPNISSIKIPNGVTSIGKEAFCWSGMSSIAIPNSVTSLGRAAFAGCEELETITLSNNLINIEEEIFYWCESLKSIKIPEGVKSIGSLAFNGCESLTTITLPDSVEYIGDSAFSYCDNLSSITIPDTVKYIGNDAFVGCPSSLVLTIGKNSYYVAYEEKDYSDNQLALTYNQLILTPTTPNDSPDMTNSENECQHQGAKACMNYNAFCPQDDKYHCQVYLAAWTCLECNEIIKTLTGTINIDHNYYSEVCFYCNHIKSVSVNANTNSKDWFDYALAGNRDNERYVIIDNDAIEISNDEFKDQKNINIKLPDSIKKIGHRAFKNNSIYAMYLPDGVETIGDEAFANCENLHTIVIPASVTSIGVNAFEGCNQLTSLMVRPDSYAEEYCWEYDLEYSYYDDVEDNTFAKTLYETNDYSFYFTEDNSVVIVQYDNKEAALLLPEQLFGYPVKAIESYAFHNFDQLRFVTIPASVVSIGKNAFDGCNNLKTIFVHEYSYAQQYCIDNNLPFEIILSTTAAEKTNPIEVKAKASEVYLRNNKGSSIDRIEKGDTVYITGYDPDCELFTAEYKNQTGYVKGAGFDISKDELLDYFK